MKVLLVYEPSEPSIGTALCHLYDWPDGISPAVGMKIYDDLYEDDELRIESIDIFSPNTPKEHHESTRIVLSVVPQLYPTRDESFEESKFYDDLSAAGWKDF